MHLKVADLDRALAFYCGVLGFGLKQRYGTQAAFVSAGNYHHHIGLNAWESAGGIDGQADSHAEHRGGDVERHSVRGCGHQHDARADDDQDAEDLMVNVRSTKPQPFAQSDTATTARSGSLWSRSS